MEKNVKVDTYLTLRKDTLEKTQEEANKNAISEYGKEDGKDELRYDDLSLNADEIYFEDGKISLSGNFFNNGKDMGYLTLNIPLGNDTIIEIIEYYVDKLKKIKEVISATK